MKISNKVKSKRAALAMRGTVSKRNEIRETTFEQVFEAAPEAMMVATPEGEILFVNARAQRIFGYTSQDLLGRSLEELVRGISKELSEYRRSREGRKVNRIRGYALRGARNGGHEFPVEIRIGQLPGKHGPLILILRDISDPQAVEADLQRARLDAHARADELSAILDAAPGMTLIARDPACRLMTGGRVAYDLLRRPYGSNLSKSAPIGERPTNFRVYSNGRELSVQELPVQKAAALGQEVRDSEMTIVFRNGDRKDFLGNAAPLLNNDGTVRGAVGVFVDITERKLAERSTRELYAHMMRVQDNERRRIARELHDSVGQNLTGLVLSLGALKRASAGLDKKFRKALVEGLVSAREAARDVRTLSGLLHPPLLHEFGLPDAIRTYVHGFSERSGIKVDIQLPARSRRFDKDVETTLLRVVQEALTNVYRHSGSKRAIVRMRLADKRLVLEVKDFGRGLKVSADRNKRKDPKVVGIGIPGIRERLQHFGGKLELHSNARGTLLRAVLPITPPRD